MFPSDWSTQTGQRRNKRPRGPDELTTAAATTPPVQSESEPPPSASAPLEDLQLPSLILRNVNTASRAPATPAELNLDAILSRVPYREILENLYGREHYPHPDVPVVTRAYEEAFLREPMPHSGERPCVAGELCECNFIDPCMPFVGVEFTLPSESITKPETPQFCVLCSRKVTQKLFYDVLFTGKEVHGVIQRYGNICSVSGASLSLSRVSHHPARKRPLQRRHAVPDGVEGVQHRVQVLVEHGHDLGKHLVHPLERLVGGGYLLIGAPPLFHLVRVQPQHGLLVSPLELRQVRLRHVLKPPRLVPDRVQKPLGVPRGELGPHAPAALVAAPAIRALPPLALPLVALPLLPLPLGSLPLPPQVLLLLGLAGPCLLSPRLLPPLAQLPLLLGAPGASLVHAPLPQMGVERALGRRGRRG